MQGAPGGAAEGLWGAPGAGSGSPRNPAGRARRQRASFRCQARCRELAASLCCSVLREPQGFWTSFQLVLLPLARSLFFFWVPKGMANRFFSWVFIGSVLVFQACLSYLQRLRGSWQVWSVCLCLTPLFKQEELVVLYCIP